MLVHYNAVPQVGCDIIAASPNANGFLGAKGTSCYFISLKLTSLYFGLFLMILVYKNIEL
jgi:hypothetical protein